jgi:type VI secretion system secreted protein VgrG
MPNTYLEENRFLYIESKLGPNELLLESFTGSEGISQLFSFQLELLSENKRIKFEDILGQEISFGVLNAEEGDNPRYFHGIVTAFAQLPDTARLSRYRAIVSPKFWILTQKQNCRIFQNLSVPDILKKVLDGIDVAWELRGSYQKREYCVQYRETDFNFVSRLMEEDGIFYFFRYTKNGHKLVISDSNASHQDMPGQSSLIYDEVSGGTREETHVSGWIKSQELGPGKLSLRDYFFETPSTDLSVHQDIKSPIMVGKVSHKLSVGGNVDFEIYDYPGRYERKNQGDQLAKSAMEQIEMSQLIIQGESNIYHLTPGYRFALTKHPNADGSYVLISITHSASESGFHSTAESGMRSAKDVDQNRYANSFRSIPAGVPFRPPRTADKSHIWGCQTAVVVGSSGEEIYTDQYGRVKVQFHWDRVGKHDQSSSCWIRVATHWAGKNWGDIHLPRIGQEVVVDFLEGDPDRPIIVGSVYNAMQTVPYALPANSTQSGIKSNSSKGGGGYNQIRFEDKKGSEEVLIHAQKDMNLKVENDWTVAILHDDKSKISNNRSTEVGVDYETKVGGKRTIEAGSEITLKTGAAKIVMKSSGDIDISGVNISISGSASLTAKGLTVKVEATTTNTIKGALVNIN